jgi:argonaute-like protein implicated in RNA metabolism and viral defense
LILIYLPQVERNSTQADSLYNVAKGECFKRGVASQVIFEETVTNEYADGNIIAGIIGKTGNVPYVLADPLDFLDIVVGLDIARRPNPRGGSTNVAAMSRIYLNTGEFSGHYSDTGIVQGETLPRALLESLFSRQDFGGKRVAIHRDGPFRGSELQDLQNWAEQIGATFFPIEIVKAGAARMYRNHNNNIVRPNKADVFYLSSSSAYVAS